MTIEPEDLLTGAAYARARDTLLAEQGVHKATRRLCLGPHVGLLFEDARTVAGHVQEIAWIERRDTPAALAAEIAHYRCLLPGPGQLTATLTLHSGTPAFGDRLSRGLARGDAVLGLSAGEHACPGRTLCPDALQPSAVHYVGFALPPGLRAALEADAPAHLWLQLPGHDARSALPASLRASLLSTLRAHDGPTTTPPASQTHTAHTR